ncbi:hypothetical protein LV779_13865 [Streptomyces thinghirensis]|nr:hypothetical protein [Streptomyces thinghirensis]
MRRTFATAGGHAPLTVTRAASFAQVSTLPPSRHRARRRGGLRPGGDPRPRVGYRAECVTGLRGG